MSGKDKEVFSNTRKSANVRQFVIGLLPIICIEFIIVGVVIYFFVPRGWPLLLAFALFFSLYLYAVSVFAIFYLQMNYTCSWGLGLNTVCQLH